MTRVTLMIKNPTTPHTAPEANRNRIFSELWSWRNSNYSL